MKRQVSRKVLESLCGQPGPDDGVDPRAFFKPQSSRRDGRKDRQLCRQISETLNFVLSGELNDDVLRGVYVQQAEPAPDASRILVTVAPLGSVDEGDPALILERLQAASKRLRAEIARSISRRKAPELVFRVAFADSTDEPRGEEQP